MKAIITQKSELTLNLNQHFTFDILDDGTYKYFWFEDASLNYYIMRKTKTTSVFAYTKGTGGYASVYVSSTAGPSGSPTFASYGVTF